MNYIVPSLCPGSSWIPSAPAWYLSPARLRDSSPAAPAFLGSLSAGKNHRHLRTLLRAPRSPEPQVPAPARIGLVNARSLANKTFILRDFFSSRSLNFLCVTETWIGAGKCSALVKLLPAACSYFNSPWTSGCGGGTATVYKNSFKCKQCAVSS